MKYVTGIRNAMDKGLSRLCSGLFMALTAVGMYQIVVRYLFNRPSTVSEELLTYGFTWLALLSSALVFGKREHMRMSFCADRLNKKAGLVLEIVTELLVLVFAAVVMVYGGLEIVRLTMSQSTASLGIPMGVVYVAVLLSGILTVVYAVLNIMELCSSYGKEEG